MIETTQAIRALLFTGRINGSRHVVSLLEKRGVRVMEQPLDSAAEYSAGCALPDVILIEQSDADNEKWQQLAGNARCAYPAVPVILLTGSGSEALAIAALRLGVRDYLRLPVSASALYAALDRAQETKPDAGSESPLDPIVGSSQVLCRVKTYMMRAAKSDCTVLITGETGTGK